MSNLKRNSFFCFLTSIIFFACTTSSYRIINQTEYITGLSVSPDRVLLECEYQYDHEIKGGYGFLMHVLDEENTVITIGQSNLFDKEDCFYRIKKIRKILEEGRHIYIGGRGDLKELRVKGSREYIFPIHGKFYENGRGLQFTVIANEKGGCFNVYKSEKEPCPGEPFSFQK